MAFGQNHRYLTLWGPFNFIIKTYKIWLNELDPFYRFIFLIANFIFLIIVFYIFFHFLDHLISFQRV